MESIVISGSQQCREPMVYVVVRLNKLLNKESICLSFAKQGRSCDVTRIYYGKQIPSPRVYHKNYAHVRALLCFVVVRHESILPISVRVTSLTLGQSLPKSFTINSLAIGQHDDVIKWKHSPRYWPFVRGIHR